MKKIFLILLTTAVTSLQAQSYKFCEDYTSKETSLLAEVSKFNVSVETFGMVNNSFQESYLILDYTSLNINIDNVTFSTSNGVLSI
tara:strand:+ start:78 stop:335 length:258 start_codon:yes stop_codon:yes gene_type:complete